MSNLGNIAIGLIVAGLLLVRQSAPPGQGNLVDPPRAHPSRGRGRRDKRARNN